MGKIMRQARSVSSYWHTCLSVHADLLLLENSSMCSIFSFSSQMSVTSSGLVPFFVLFMPLLSGLGGLGAAPLLIRSFLLLM